MYTLERTCKYKAVWGILSFCFLTVSIWGLYRGGEEILIDGFMNEPLPSITMVASFFAAIISFFIFLTLHAIQKDIAEQLKCMKNYINSNILNS